MKAKQIWWTSAAVLVTAAVAATVGLGISVQHTYEDLDHGTPFTETAPETALQKAVPGEVDLAALKARLDELSTDEALATFGGQVIDTTTGEVIWDKNASTPLVPASSTKLLTIAAATAELDESERLRTQVLKGAEEGNVIIKASGDVWLDAEQLDALAEPIGHAESVSIDTSVWKGPAEGKGWDPVNVDEGYVAPMEPAMYYGARLGQTEGDVPRSHEPALDVARQLATRLGTDKVGVAVAPAGAAVLSEVDSQPLSVRAQHMIKHSDNVAAEAIGREMARSRGEETSFSGTAAATLASLQEQGFDTAGVELNDASGLSVDNRIPPALLAQIAQHAVTQDSLRPILDYLPIAGGEGSLYDRYSGSGARGYVRAKTGTLTGTSALAGTAQGESGRVYAFAFMVNDGDLLAARQAQDRLAAALHDF
ncbi:D-alanyl-D-alanine carboxypeptidase/D-alanyl-D-alanine endopeptidase [Corynebacterium flavescens]|uniref:D-alanyl-D-alanine carboxypeptidase/D-alanyl-D-alanine endopeptidase n=1 Tax=Corynebacterium flavescens TaxID=28028 RepID=UPI003FD3D07D